MGTHCPWVCRQLAVIWTNYNTICTHSCKIHVPTVLDAAITAREGAILGHITYRCAHPAPKLSTLNLSCQALVPPRLCIPVPTLTVNWPAHAAQWGPMQDATGPAQLILGNSIRV